MARFRQKQFEMLADIINRHTRHFDVDLKNHELDLNATNKMLNSLINDFCVEFRRDNYRFNETLFRERCGPWIEQEDYLKNG